MKITEALLGEHGLFYAEFDQLQASVPKADDIDAVKSQGALLRAGIESHASLEEDLLFVNLDQQVGPMGPLAVMRSEHEEIERTMSLLAEVEDLEQARDQLLHAVQVAREHFAKEERVLFPMAEQVLRPEELHQLGARWAEARGVALSF